MCGNSWADRSDKWASDTYGRWRLRENSAIVYIIHFGTSEMVEIFEVEMNSDWSIIIILTNIFTMCVCEKRVVISGDEYFHKWSEVPSEAFVMWWSHSNFKQMRSLLVTRDFLHSSSKSVLRKRQKYSWFCIYDCFKSFSFKSLKGGIWDRECS